MYIPITALFTAFSAILIVPLALQVSIHYVRTGTDQATPNVLQDESLRRKTRAHGNFIENIPLGLILLGVVELGGTPDIWVWAMGWTFLGGRIVHAVGQLTMDGPVLRGVGMIASYLVYLTGAVWIFINCPFINGPA